MNVRHVFSIIDRASGPLSRVNRGLKRNKSAYMQAAGSQKKFGSGMAGMAVSIGVTTVAITALTTAVVGLGAALPKAVGIAGEYQKEFVTVGNIAQATGAQLKVLNDEALRLGVLTRFSPVEAMQGMRNLAAMGWTVKETLKLIPNVLDAAEAGFMELGQSANTVSAGMRGFGIPINQAAQFIDKLTKATTVSGMRFEDYEHALSVVALSSKFANQSVEKTLATMGALKDMGTSTVISAHALAAALKRLEAPGPRARKLYNQYGLENIVYDPKTDKLRDVIDIFRDIDKITSKMKGTERGYFLDRVLGQQGKQVFRVAAGMREYQGEMTTGFDIIEKMTKSIRNSTGITAKFRKENRKTWEGAKLFFKGTLQTIGIVIGQRMLPKLSSGLNSVTRHLNVFLQAISGVTIGGFGTEVDTMRKALGILDKSWGEAFRRMGMSVKSMWRGISPILGEMAFAFGFLSAALGHLIQISDKLAKIAVFNWMGMDLPIGGKPKKHAPGQIDNEIKMLRRERDNLPKDSWNPFTFNEKQKLQSRIRSLEIEKSGGLFPKREMAESPINIQNVNISADGQDTLMKLLDEITTSNLAVTR